MKFLHLDFVPRSADVALLVLRVWYGLALLGLHGWGKLANFGTMKSRFADPFGLGMSTTLALAVVGEVVCMVLLVLGLFTRVAALGGAITMSVAFWFVHQHRLAGENNGELAFVYLGAFVALFVAGAGRFSVDAKLGVKA